MASIHSITYQPVKRQEEYIEDQFLRIPIEEAQLIENFGMEGDAKAGHNLNRQLNLVSQDWVQSLSDQGFKTAPGQFGEQMSVSGIELTDLPEGTLLQLGSQAVIELTKNRTGCVRLETVQGKTLQEINGPIGVLAKVVTGGMIQVGDDVKVLEAA